MKRILIGTLAVLSMTAAMGQNVVLGERTPELRIKSWLDDRAPIQGRTTLLVFFHSASRPSVESLGHVQALGAKFGDRLNVVVLAREESADVRRLVAPYAQGTSRWHSMMKDAASRRTMCSICRSECWLRPRDGPCGWAIRDS